MPKNKETSPKNMRRLSRDLFSDAEIYQEVAQRAYESQTEGDKDDDAGIYDNCQSHDYTLYNN